MRRTRLISPVLVMVAFIASFAYAEKGVVIDTQTGLMWAARDNGSDIDWHGAKRYCESYRGSGYTDWRMPTQNELAELYRTGEEYILDCSPQYTVRIKKSIKEVVFYSWAMFPILEPAC